MSGGVWAGLIMSRVVDVADGYVATPESADAVEALGRIHLAEALGAVLGLYELWLPADDTLALSRARRYGSSASGLGPGILAALPDGRLALGISATLAVESLGDRLAVVDGAERYVEFWALPGVAYLQEKL